MRGSTAGITDGLQGQSKAHYLLLSILDILIGTLVITPLVIAYWRATWGLFDTYVFPDNPLSSALTSVGISFAILFVFNLFQKKIRETLNPDIHRLLFYTLSRLYTKLFSIACVNSWRGIWDILDIVLGTDDPRWTALSVLFAFVLLIPMKTLRNLSAPPFAIVTDRYKGYFDVPTLFRIRASQNMFLYVMDSFFSVFVIGSLVVFVWRGLWGLLDIYLYNADSVKSAAASLTMGYTLVFSTFLLQPLVKRVVSKISGFWRVFIVDVYLLFSLCGTVNVWRGIWATLDCYFETENPKHKVVGFWLSHIVCFLILVFINSSNSILVRGVYIDAEEDGGKCVDFPCYYLRLFFQSKRRKKFLKQLQKKQEVSRRKSEDNHISCETLVPTSGQQDPLINHIYLHHKRASIISPSSPTLPRETNTVV
ncbi:hypothetical protein M8J75_002948 [Diaphorina citri]|nr:hypothetical protein M8J75_002948 [Diaphorina citri]KAI5752118.1 hypothetical protein M8J77_014009 [Diaphorina citri]